ncbi:MAG: hypothetical protein JXB25_01425 [Deltaproteobacteria bacterium]|nr:hypothetical protein [Deltaproteobacteria bacterium]
MRPQFLEKKIVAFEVAGNEIRAAIVKKSGRRFQVADFAALKRPNPEEDLPPVETIRALAERLHVASGPVVFVTPLARAFELLMDRKKISRLKHYQLVEAVKWEVEPYTGISGQNALIGVETARRPEVKPGEIAPEESDDINVTVSAIERNVYRALKARFKVAGFSLGRVFPPDVCFYMPLYLEPSDAPRAVLEVGEDYSNFAILKGNVPEQINTLSISLETLATQLSGEGMVEGLEETLRFTVRQAPGPEPLIVSGSGAANGAVLDYIASFSTHGVRPLSLSRAAGLTESGADPANALFGTVVGAGLRELRSPRDRLVGISDREALIPRLKKSAYLMPLAVTALFVVLLGGHYLFMKHQDVAYKQRIEELSRDLKARKGKVEQYDGLLKELKKLEDEAALLSRKIAFFEKEADAEIIRVIDSLRGIGAAAPRQVVLVSLVQNGSPDEYTVVGRAYGQRWIGVYATDLQALPWCRSATLVKVEGDKEALRFEFLIKTGSRES